MANMVLSAAAFARGGDIEHDVGGGSADVRHLLLAIRGIISRRTRKSIKISACN